MALVAVVVAGGRSSRMAQDKAGLRLGGVPLLQRAVDACLAAGCRQVVTVLPEHLAERYLSPDPRVGQALEDPPFGGPAAGIAAGVAALAPRPDDLVLLLACDLPRVDQLVPLLADAPDTGVAVVPVDAEGYPQFLAGRYPATTLLDALAQQPDPRDLSVRRLMRPVDHVALAAPPGVLADVDDPGQARAAGVELE